MRLELVNAKRRIEKTSDIATILGDGWSLPNDLGEIDEVGDVFAIGRSYDCFKGQIIHWVNVDGADSKWWAEHLPYPYIRHSIGDFDWYDIDWEPKEEIKYTEDTQWHGSSSLFAVYIALAIGYKEITLAGCPLDSKGHWWAPEHKGPEWTGYTYQAWIDFAKTDDSKRVRSLSGYTRMILEQGYISK